MTYDRPTMEKCPFCADFGPQKPPICIMCPPPRRRRAAHPSVSEASPLPNCLQRTRQNWLRYPRLDEAAVALYYWIGIQRNSCYVSVCVPSIVSASEEEAAINSPCCEMLKLLSSPLKPPPPPPRASEFLPIKHEVKFSGQH